MLDIDAKHKEAHTWWTTNKAKLLPTRVHRTRSGGLHLIYGNYDGLRNSTSKIAKGVDVRGDGGYIIWWPAAGCEVLSDAPCAPWPDWLEWLVEPPQPPRPAPASPKLSTPVERRARLEGLIASVLKAPEGNRNACLFWAACTVHEVPDLLPHERDEAIAALFQAGRDIGLHNIEINRTLKSAERRVG